MADTNLGAFALGRSRIRSLREANVDDKIVSTTQYRDGIIIFCESGAVYKMTFDELTSYNMQVQKLGDWKPKL